MFTVSFIKIVTIYRETQNIHYAMNSRFIFEHKTKILLFLEVEMRCHKIIEFSCEQLWLKEFKNTLSTLVQLLVPKAYFLSGNVNHTKSGLIVSVSQEQNV